MGKIIIAVDGPAGAGKSTISKIVAEKLNIEYIDTGAMYRAVTLKLLKNNIPIEEDEKIKEILEKTDVSLSGGRVYLDNEDVSEEIRMPYVTKNVSEVSAKPYVREKLIKLQRNMAMKKNVIMDGRDIGTNVLKDATHKIFLTATVEERARRRYKELCEKKIEVSFESVYKDIENRDHYDSTRKINPLRRAEDAILVDSTSKGIDDIVNEILNIVRG